MKKQEKPIARNIIVDNLEVKKFAIAAGRQSIETTRIAPIICIKRTTVSEISVSKMK